jgi:hypothetical protein
MHIRPISFVPNPFHLLPSPFRCINEPKLQHIIPFLFNRICNVDMVSNVHVSRLQYQLLVEVHRDDGVQAIED